MEPKKKNRRKLIIILISLVIILAACGLMIRFIDLVKSILFLLVPLAIFFLGWYYLITRPEGKKREILLALWIGFTLALTALVGMMVDPRTQNLGWLSRIEVFGIVSVGTFLFVLVFTPAVRALYKAFWKL